MMVCPRYLPEKVISILATATTLVVFASATTCDIFDAAGTPCVAAHSTVRALYGDFGGNLYQLIKSSDNTTIDVGVTTAGGFADTAAHESFCGDDRDDTECTIHRVYDQSPRGNHLDLAPPGGASARAGKGVFANREKLTIGGSGVYGMHFEATRGGYRIEETSGVATGDDEETMYMVVSGRHYNDDCCFDYGNAEVDALDDGKGTMEALYFGNKTDASHGAGKGPWVMADLEQGLWGCSESDCEQDVAIDADFVTAMLKGGSGKFGLKGGDAQSGELVSLYEGVRPHSYDPMKKQGSIILGIGGDNSDRAVGTFYEGVMTTGYTSDDTDGRVQANIVAAGYGN